MFELLSLSRFFFLLSRFLSNANSAKTPLMNRESRSYRAGGGALESLAELASIRSADGRLLLSDILIRFCERVPYAWMVIFAMDYIGMSAQQVGILTSIEMLAAHYVLFPPRITPIDIGASHS